MLCVDIVLVSFTFKQIMCTAAVALYAKGRKVCAAVEEHNYLNVSQKLSVASKLEPFVDLCTKKYITFISLTLTYISISLTAMYHRDIVIRCQSGRLDAGEF